MGGNWNVKGLWLHSNGFHGGLFQNGALTQPKALLLLLLVVPVERKCTLTGTEHLLSHRQLQSLDHRVIVEILQVSQRSLTHTSQVTKELDTHFPGHN